MRGSSIWRGLSKWRGLSIWRAHGAGAMHRPDPPLIRADMARAELPLDHPDAYMETFPPVCECMLPPDHPLTVKSVNAESFAAIVRCIPIGIYPVGRSGVVA